MRTFFLRVCLAVGLFVSPLAAQIPSDPVQCLATNIAREAPDEPYAGKLAVATVTMNRVQSRSFPKSVCAVVYQRNRVGCQFSWTCEKRTVHINSATYNEAVDIAKKVLDGLRLPAIKNSTYFHNTHVAPRWMHDRDITRVTQIGRHIFYASTGQ